MKVPDDWRYALFTRPAPGERKWSLLSGGMSAAGASLIYSGATFAQGFDILIGIPFILATFLLVTWHTRRRLRLYRQVASF
jgi:hypothetical protein